MKKTALLLSILMSALVPVSITAEANSAQMYWSGSFAGGAMVIGGECPVRVESELLTFDVDEFPQNYYSDTEEDVNKFLNYGGRVTASYNFYNPAEYDVNVTLAFPFGNSPDYFYYYGEYDDTAKYSVTVDGKEVETKLRHTSAYYDFDAETEVAKLNDSFKEDKFYTPETPVYIYRFAIGGLSGNTDSFITAEIEFKDSADRKIISTANGSSTGGGGSSICWFVRNGDDIEIYSVGKPMNEEELAFKFYYYGKFDKKIYVQGNAERNKAKDEVITFKQLALSTRSQGYGGAVSETDWYNAVIDSLNRDDGGRGIIRTACLSPGFYGLMRWYQYTLTIPAGGRLVHEVTAPLYPSIDGEYTPSVYGYEYLLSPAKGWAGFGTLEVRVNTPFYIIGNGNFEKTEYGYVYLSDGLPDGELTFKLCSEENPQISRSGCGSIMSVFPYLIIPLAIITGIAAVIVGLVFLIIYIVRKAQHNRP